jgi:hypothetical protein
MNRQPYYKKEYIKQCEVPFHYLFPGLLHIRSVASRKISLSSTMRSSVY